MAGKPEALEQAKKWFHWANYEPFKTMSATEWGQQITKRVLVREALRSTNSSMAQDSIEALIQQITEDQSPCSPFGHARWVHWPVRLLNKQDVDRIANLFTKDKMSLSANHVDDLGPESPFAMLAHYVVDLRFRDDEILSGIKELLEARRASLPDVKARPKFHKDILNRWHVQGIIPYCDLKMWAKWKNVTLTNRQINHLLFGDAVHNYDSQQFRATYNNAKRHITVETAQRLVGQSELPSLEIVSKKN